MGFHKQRSELFRVRLHLSVEYLHVLLYVNLMAIWKASTFVAFGISGSRMGLYKTHFRFHLDVRQSHVSNGAIKRCDKNINVLI